MVCEENRRVRHAYRAGSPTWCLTALFAILLAAGPAFAQLDETWTVTVGGRAVQVNPDGSFLIPNVAAPDLFGAGGLGTPPDFFSDDFVRLIGVRTVNGVTQWAYSERFQFSQGILKRGSASSAFEKKSHCSTSLVSLAI